MYYITKGLLFATVLYHSFVYKKSLDKIETLHKYVNYASRLRIFSGFWKNSSILERKGLTSPKSSALWSKQMFIGRIVLISTFSLPSSSLTTIGFLCIVPIQTTHT